MVENSSQLSITFRREDVLSLPLGEAVTLHVTDNESSSLGSFICNLHLSVSKNSAMNRMKGEVSFPHRRLTLGGFGDDAPVSL